MARRKRRQSLTEALGLSQPETPEETVERLERESQTLAMRLNSQGVDATKPAPKDSGLTKLLKTLGLPGAAVRSALGEATDDEYGFNASRAFSKERLWNNPVSGIQLLDQLGLAPTKTDSFGNKAARFGLGLGVDIVTDPISYLLGGVTRPLQIGAPFASTGLKITEQGLAQPLLRGAQAGLRSTGELGAALGDAGVLAARKAASSKGMLASEASASRTMPNFVSKSTADFVEWEHKGNTRNAIKDLTERMRDLKYKEGTAYADHASDAVLNDLRDTHSLYEDMRGELELAASWLRDSANDARRLSADAIKTAAGQVAPRALTKMERIGLDLGTSLKKNETTRGIIGAFSKNAFADPAYVALRNKLARDKTDKSRKALDELKGILQSGKFTPEDAQLVADLAEDSGLRAKYAAPAFGEGPPVPLQHVTPLTYPAPKPASAPLQQAAASELATNKAPTLLESLGLAEAPTFPSGRKPGGVLPEVRARATGNTPVVSAERVSPNGKFRIQVGVQNKALPSGVVNTPETLKQATPEQLLQELAYQIDNGGPVSGTVNTVLEMVRRGVWEDLSKSLPIGAQRMYRQVAEHNAFRMLPSIGDSDASTRAFLSQRAPDFIRSIPDEDTRILFQTRIDNALRDAEPLTPTKTIAEQGVREAPIPPQTIPINQTLKEGELLLAKNQERSTLLAKLRVDYPNRTDAEINELADVLLRNDPQSAFSKYESYTGQYPPLPNIGKPTAFPSGRQPGNTLPEIPGVPQGHPGNLPPESLKPNGRFNVDTVDKTRVARTGLDATISALQKHTDEQLLQELSARVASGSKEGVTHVMLEMTRRGIWEKGSAMLPFQLQKAYNDILRRGTNGLLPAIGATDDEVRALLSQRGEDLLNRMKDVDARDVAKVKVAQTLENALPLQEGDVISPATARTPGAPHADAIAENNKRVAEVVEGLRNPNITPIHPRDLRRPDAEGTHRLLEEIPLQVLPDHVYQAFRFVTDTLKDYGDERLKRGLLSSILANYFPHKLLPEEGARIGLSGMTASQGSAKTRTLRDTLANLANDPLAPKFERNFVRPFAKEVVESIRGIKTYDFFDDVVKQYGIKQEDMLARFGYDPGMKFAKPVGDYTLVDFAEFMNKGRQSEAYSKLGKVYLPNEIARDLKQIHSAYDTDEGINTFLKMWDGASNVWKPLVTSLRPAFHVNNFIGNMWNSFLGGMTNPNRILDGIDIVLNRPHEWKAGATKVSTAEMKALGEKWGAFDASRFMDDLSTGNPLRLAQEGMPSTKDGLAKTFFNKAVSLGQRGGAFVESMNRAALFTDQMLKRITAAGDKFTPDMLDTLARESADHVNKYLFDYAHGLTKFESGILRRIAPFYSWTRFNLPLQVAEAINQPGKFLLYGKVRDNLAQLNPSPDEMPPWMNEGLKVGTNKDGSPIIFNPRLPLQDISRLSPGASGRELTGMLNPLIKTPLELATNQNFYTGRPITKYEGETTPVFGGLMRVPTKLDFAATELGGAVGQTGKAIEGIRPDSSPADKLRTIRMVFPGLYSYDPRKERVNRAYEETRRLGDLIRKQQDETGKKVPTARQLGLAR